jgi:acyl carrier protein
MTIDAELTKRIASREAILARLRPVLARLLHFRRELDELDADAPLFGSGFGLDSLDAVEIVVCLETEFGVRVSEQALLRGSMRSLNKLVDLVIAKGGSPRVAPG